MNERDRFSTWLGLWYELGRVMQAGFFLFSFFFFSGEAGSFSLVQKNCLREKAAKGLGTIICTYI